MVKKKTRRKQRKISKTNIQATKQSVIVNIIKPQRKVRNTRGTSIPQLRKIEYVGTFGLGHQQQYIPMINQPQSSSTPVRILKPEMQSIGVGENLRGGEMQVGRPRGRHAAVHHSAGAASARRTLKWESEED